VGVAFEGWSKWRRSQLLRPSSVLFTDAVAFEDGASGAATIVGASVGSSVGSSVGASVGSSVGAV
jgi:hypothetical protein